MSGDSRIISFGTGNTDAAAPNAQSFDQGFDQGPNQATDGARLRDALGDEAAASEDLAATPDNWDMAWVASDARGEADWPADTAPSPVRALVAPLLAGTFALGWSALFLAARWPSLRSGVTLAEVPALVTQWCVPVLLIGLVWLLVLRHSAREGRRFGDVARTLSVESDLLERRLASVNRELSLAREFVAAQARDLETLGRLASERLSTNAGRLEELIRDNGARVETISTVSSAALENMEKLRGQLPVIASSAKDVTNNIGNAGRTAHSQLEDLIAGFNRLNEFGLASERQVSTLRTAIDAALSQFAGQCEDLDVIARQRFAALTEQSAQFRTELERHEIEALASIQTRASALKDEIALTREQLDENEAGSLTSLRARLSGLREECDVVGRSFGAAQERARHDLQHTLETLVAQHSAARETISADHDSALARLTERLGVLSAATNETEARLTAAQENVVAALRERLASLAQHAQGTEDAFKARDERFRAEVQARQDRQLEQERHAIARVNQMLAELDGTLAERLERHRHQADALTERARAVTGELEQSEARLRSIAVQSSDTETRLLASVAALGDSLAASRASLASADGDVAKLTEDSLRLLDLLRASAQQAHGTLPEAMAVSEERLTRLESGIASVRALLDQAAQSGQALSGSLDGSATTLSALNRELEAAQIGITTRGEEHTGLLADLTATLDTIQHALIGNTERARGELRDAVNALHATLAEAIAAIETEAPARIENVTHALGDASGKAIDKAMRTTVAEISGQLEQAVAHASGVSREATLQLGEQIERVNDLVGNLERRVAEAREQATETVNNDFARRAALITESLNSNAIDIAASLSSEISDTAWAAYLRGDRGIFTRRAVTLIDNSEARAIQQTYERDDVFREHVSRYIHDFESLLRQVLSTRDGNAMGVTLLSSDMGKLYVALAQGIERLRS
ncbi:ATPase [Novosphingobium sp. 1949]|uniref:ATPase n=1 Tax=Novosphingobium organovorum TaxID=2930092 RepID=A0ABT0B7T5_9SPHN|nr:ATPase [Novosphingobium organovorum]MCJ2181130.1 ATPase [Novosphingobium organovorum]